MFAGPCTAGSPWSRLNEGKSDSTKVMLSLKQETYWMLWERFSEAYKACAKLGFALLLELPRHCEYWRSPKVQKVLNDGKCEVHELDGCMYGLVGKNKMPIKKPWKMLTWNLPVGNGLRRKCDGSREHTPCAGSDTKGTQLYTPLIVKLIVDSLALRNHRAVRVGESTRVGVKEKARAMCCVMPHWFHDDNTSDEDVTCPIEPAVGPVAQFRDTTRSHVDLLEVVLSCQVGYIFKRSENVAIAGWGGPRPPSQGEWCDPRSTMSRISIVLGGGIHSIFLGGLFVLNPGLAWR